MNFLKYENDIKKEGYYIMSETRKLYYEDVYKKEFTAKVLECREGKKGYEIILDQTAFYPEGGGQPCDMGTLNDVEVLEVHEKNGEIIHYTKKAIEAGSEVTGKIDWERRFDLMQQHSGEHIVSGLVHEAYGYDNVGFHMSSDVITVDLSGVLTEAQLAEIETETNRKIWENSEVEINMEEQSANKKLITETLKNYNIEISSITATVGPTVTLYEIKPAPGVRIARIKSLENDIALSLSALGIRIIAPIPGKGTVGIEVPNKDPKMVSMYSVLASKKFQECKYELPLALGKSITNEVCIADLCKMPHILVAGATGQGKSVGLNAIITSLLYKKHPAQLKFVLVDPKMVEFSIYSVIERHFMAKLPDAEKSVITDSDKVIATLNSLCIEMDNRYALLAKANVRTIKEYNEEFIHRKLNPNNGHKFMPYIVVIIDEFADLIMMAGRDVEMPIARIAQKARAVGIHMIIATQRPSTTVITGNIKANFPARIAFRVMQMVDSRTILDAPGANQLIGRGDMLFTEGGDLKRIQCAFIDTPEVKRICEYISKQQGYPEPYELPEYKNPDSDAGSNGNDVINRDPLFEEAAKMIVVSGQASTSSLQRRYSIGYNRAGRLMDQLEAAGIVGPSEGGKPRQVLIVDIMALENKLELMK